MTKCLAQAGTQEGRKGALNIEEPLAPCGIDHNYDAWA